MQVRVKTPVVLTAHELRFVFLWNAVVPVCISNRVGGCCDAKDAYEVDSESRRVRSWWTVGRAG